MIDDAWRDQARCAKEPPELFFPEGAIIPSVARQRENAARVICGECAVQRPCLATALAYHAIDDYGVWGGTTAEERVILRREARIAETALT